MTDTTVNFLMISLKYLQLFTVLGNNVVSCKVNINVINYCKKSVAFNAL